MLYPSFTCLYESPTCTNNGPNIAGIRLGNQLPDDETLYDSLYEELRNYYNEQTTLRRSHPFLTEAVADYTDAPNEAARLYELSIEQAKELSGEPTHTKKISLAERLVQLGRTAEARSFLREGRAEADACGDVFWRNVADELAQQIENVPAISEGALEQDKYD